MPKSFPNSSFDAVALYGCFDITLGDDNTKPSIIRGV